MDDITYRTERAITSNVVGAYLRYDDAQSEPQPADYYAQDIADELKQRGYVAFRSRLASKCTKSWPFEDLTGYSDEELTEELQRRDWIVFRRSRRK